jgi:hypothetical protein
MGVGGNNMAGMDKIVYWLTTFATDSEQNREECLKELVQEGEWKTYAFKRGNRQHKHIRKGHRICFYAAPHGVVAYATVAREPKSGGSWKYPWVCPLRVFSFIRRPVVIDAELRRRLNAFKKKRPNARRQWGWFVQVTRPLTLHDFKLLIGGK